MSKFRLPKRPECLTMLILVFGAAITTASIGQAFTVIPGFKHKNVTAIAWKDNLIFQQLFNPFISSKNDWDATPTKVGFAFNSTSPTLVIGDVSTANNYRGQTFTNSATGKAEVYLNWYYLASDTDTRRRSTSGHELGHALGLDHSTGAVLMNDARNRDQVFSPKTDDINGVNSIYP
jgi:Matrixin